MRELEQGDTDDFPCRHALPLHRLAALAARASSARSGCPSARLRREEVYELAKRRGMDFVTITDHDTIDGCARARRPSRLLRLRGADRPLCRRASGGSRPLLRDHSRRPRVAAGPFRRRRGLRRIPARERDRLRARAPLLQRRRAADTAPPAATGGALPDLGGPQRVARRRAEHARRRLRRDARRHRDRRLRRPCRRRHRPHLHRGARPLRTPEEFLAHLRDGDAEARRRTGSAPPSGPTRRWRWRRGRSATPSAGQRGAAARAARPGRGPEDGRTGDPRGRRARGQGRRRHRPRGRPLPARGLARRRRPRRSAAAS